MPDCKDTESRWAFEVCFVARRLPWLERRQRRVAAKRLRHADFPQSAFNRKPIRILLVYDGSTGRFRHWEVVD